MSLTQTIAEALADLFTDLSPPLDIQVVTMREFKPTPPCIDIYPATPFVENAGFGRTSVRMRWTVRVRVGGNDPEGQTDLLYDFMDPYGPLSIRGSILADNTLGGIVDVQLLDQSGMLPYQDLPSGEVLPGAEWTLGIYNRSVGVS